MVPSLFILASSVFLFLHGNETLLTSALKQGHRGCRLFRLTCSVVLRGGRNTANITGVCGECLQCLSHTGFAPTHGVCVFMFYTAQALGCSAGELSEAGPELVTSQVYAAQVQVLRYSTKAQTQLGLCFVPFPGPSSSGDQVLGECSLPRWTGVSHHLSRPRCSVSWVHSRRTVSGVPCVSSGELISGCDPPGGCQPSRISGRLG